MLARGVPCDRHQGRPSPTTRTVSSLATTGMTHGYNIGSVLNYRTSQRGIGVTRSETDEYVYDRCR